MTLTKKTIMFLVTFILVISLAANVYSFTKNSHVTKETNNAIKEYKKELVEKESEIQNLKQRVGAAKKNAESEVESNSADTEQYEKLTGPEVVKEELKNTANRFIEYAFETNPETYVNRKKLARNYMTEKLYKTLYSADGIDTQAQDFSVEVKNIKIYGNAETEDEVIVYYVINEEILSSGYKNEKESYVKLKFTVEGNQLKVSGIEPLENDYGGV